jgi:hypothetical protein
MDKICLPHAQQAHAYPAGESEKACKVVRLPPISTTQTRRELASRLVFYYYIWLSNSI